MPSTIQTRSYFMILIKSLSKTILLIITISISSMSFAKNILSEDININYQNCMAKSPRLTESNLCQSSNQCLKKWVKNYQGKRDYEARCLNKNGGPILTYYTKED